MQESDETGAGSTLIERIIKAAEKYVGIKESPPNSNNVEEWRDVVGYEGLYMVSNYGRVRSLDRKIPNAHRNGTALIKGRFLRPVNRLGYLHVNLADKSGGRGIVAKKIHRLVAEAFIPNSENYPVINHKDENPLNNHFHNLEWCTVKYNTNYGTAIERMRINSKSKNAKPVIGTHVKTGEKIFLPSLTSGQDFGFNKTEIWKCANGRLEHYKGYYWRYTNERCAS